MTATRKCRRCDGTGMTHHTHVMGGVCLACDATGRIEVVDAATKAARLAAGRRRYAILVALRTAASDADGGPNGMIEHEAMSGCSLLEKNDPTRYARMLASVDAGRTAQVIDALRVYFRDHAEG